MDNKTANPSFREQIRRTWNSEDDVNQHEPNESSPLLTNGSTAGTGAINRGDSGVETIYEENGHAHNAAQFLLNCDRTPGQDHSNPIVRYASHTWHVTKITLYSSKYSRPAARSSLLLW